MSGLRKNNNLLFSIHLKKSAKACPPYLHQNIVNIFSFGQCFNWTCNLYIFFSIKYLNCFTRYVNIIIKTKQAHRVVKITNQLLLTRYNYKVGMNINVHYHIIML